MYYLNLEVDINCIEIVLNISVMYLQNINAILSNYLLITIKHQVNQYHPGTLYAYVLYFYVIYVKRDNRNWFFFSYFCNVFITVQVV